MQQKNTNKQLFAWGVFVLLGLTWGSSFILMKRGLQVFSAKELGALRIFSAALFLLPWSLSHLRQLRWVHYKYLLLTGLLGTLLPVFLFAYAQTELSSALNGILDSLVPIFVLLVGSIWFRQPVVKNELQGALLGLLGALLLIFASTENGVGKVNYYTFLPVLACFFYGLNVNLVKYYLQDFNASTIASVPFLFMGIIVGIILFAQTDFLNKVQTVERAYKATGYVLLLGFWGTAIAQLLFIDLIKRTSPVFASMVAFVIPLVALGWGLLDGEVLVGGQYLGIVTILAGVYLVNRQQRI